MLFVAEDDNSSRFFRFFDFADIVAAVSVVPIVSDAPTGAAVFISHPSTVAEEV